MYIVFVSLLCVLYVCVVGVCVCLLLFVTVRVLCVLAVCRVCCVRVYDCVSGCVCQCVFANVFVGSALILVDMYAYDAFDLIGYAFLCGLCVLNDTKCVYM